MHRLHAGLTVAAVIKPGKSDSLKILLKQVDEQQKNNEDGFVRSETTLFLSAVIIPAQPYQEEILPETFVLCTSYCGPLSNHLTDLVSNYKKLLVAIFSHCQDFPDDELVSDAEMQSYLRHHSRKGAFNSKFNCITKLDACREHKLARAIGDYVDNAQKHVDVNKLSAREVKTLIQRFVKAKGDEFAWAHKPVRKQLIEFFVVNRANLAKEFLYITVILFVLFFTRYIFPALVIILVAAALILFFVWLAFREKCRTATRPHDEHVRKLAASQLHPVLNEMTAAAPLKKGSLRIALYAIALKLANFVGSNVPTVSTIRWVTIDKGKRLLFNSIYTNTTDFYVRDFLLGTTAYGVNFMFTHGTGFPDSTVFFTKGIKADPEGYMHAVHTGQHVTDLWYRHEPNLTSDMIKKNRRIRNGLFSKMTEAEANEWLKLF